ADATAGTVQSRIGQVLIDATHATRKSGLAFYTENAGTVGERVRIDNSGNVGIGTTAPDAALEINHATGDSLRLTYNDSDGSAVTYVDTSIASTGAVTFDAAGSSAGFTFSDALTASSTVSVTGATTMSSDLVVLGNTQLGDASTDFSTINGTRVDIPNNLGFLGGNVGIGDTSPNSILDISSSTGTQLSIDFTTASSYGVLEFQEGEVQKSYIEHMGSAFTSPRNNDLEFVNTVGDLTFWTGATLTERVSILSTGNVGIGDISPDARLETLASFYVSEVADGDGDILSISNTGTVFNDDQSDRDFRVESDANDNIFVIDAGAYSGQGGIGFSGGLPGTITANFIRATPIVTFTTANDYAYLWSGTF
ncbi:MAG: hypothetical protein Q8O97_01325, partial [bacterium]|nr:hypothetical protein [bacterium]